MNDSGVVLDIYARADITSLCKGNAYSRLQWEDVTVSELLLEGSGAACAVLSTTCC